MCRPAPPAGQICLPILPVLSSAHETPAAGALLNEFAHTFLFNAAINFFAPRATAAAAGGPLARAAAPLVIATALMFTVLSPACITGPALNPAVATAWASMLAFDRLLASRPPLPPAFWGLFAALILATLGGVVIALRARPHVDRAWAAVRRAAFARPHRD